VRRRHRLRQAASHSTAVSKTIVMPSTVTQARREPATGSVRTIDICGGSIELGSLPDCDSAPGEDVPARSGSTSDRSDGFADDGAGGTTPGTGASPDAAGGTGRRDGMGAGGGTAGGGTAGTGGATDETGTDGIDGTAGGSGAACGRPGGRLGPGGRPCCRPGRPAAAG